MCVGMHVEDKAVKDTKAVEQEMINESAELRARSGAGRSRSGPVIFGLGGFGDTARDSIPLLRPNP